MFNHLEKTELPKLTRRNELGRRVYYDEYENRYESVTSVVGSIDQEGLNKWRESVGEDVANYVSRKAMTTGTRTHKIVEEHLNNTKITEENIFAKAHFTNIKPLLKNINNILGLEERLCSKSLGLAGTADCIGDYNGVPSVIDFKTSSKKKDDDWILKYYLQTTAYALMWEEQTGQIIDQIVVLISGEDGSRETYIKEKKDYIEQLNDVIQDFKKAHADEVIPDKKVKKSNSKR